MIERFKINNKRYKEREHESKVFEEYRTLFLSMVPDDIKAYIDSDYHARLIKGDACMYIDRSFAMHVRSRDSLEKELKVMMKQLRLESKRLMDDRR